MTLERVVGSQTRWSLGWVPVCSFCYFSVNVAITALFRCCVCCMNLGTGTSRRRGQINNLTTTDLSLSSTRVKLSSSVLDLGFHADSQLIVVDHVATLR